MLFKLLKYSTSNFGGGGKVKSIISLMEFINVISKVVVVARELVELVETGYSILNACVVPSVDSPY